MIGGLGNLSGGMGGLGGMAGGLGGMPGGDLGGGLGGIGEGTGTGGGASPNVQPSAQQGDSFSSTLREMVIEAPTASKAHAGNLAARLAAGENIDPHQVAIASAKAGVEIQMATRTISQAVTAVRTLFQMQV